MTDGTYVSLYRKYRPTTFADVIGQPHVVRALTGAIGAGKLHHAYLLTGPRGTGKTTLARIVARAVNCTTGPTTTPCGTCTPCTETAAGVSPDVIELDMASHGGVDDARDLRERAQYAPSSGHKKIYILDEVHMATPAAFNALLKLIEEPPSHVLFLMATTDPQKVLPTITSRVQRLDLRRVAPDDVAGHIRRIAELEGAVLDDDATAAVVRAGDGSVRDTLSVLEQVLAYGADQTTISGADVFTLLGTTATDTLHTAASHLIGRDLAALLTHTQTLVDAGTDLRTYTRDLTNYMRDLLATAVAPGQVELVATSATHADQLTDLADHTDAAQLAGIVATLADAHTQMRANPPRLTLETALAQLATSGNTTAADDAGQLAAVTADLERLRAEIAQLRTDAAAAAVAPTPATEQPATTPADADVSATAPPASGDDVTDAWWPELLTALRSVSARSHAIYRAALTATYRDGTVVLTYRDANAFHAGAATDSDHAANLQAAAAHISNVPTIASVEVLAHDTAA